MSTSWCDCAFTCSKRKRRASSTREVNYADQLNLEPTSSQEEDPTYQPGGSDEEEEAGGMPCTQIWKIWNYGFWTMLNTEPNISEEEDPTYHTDESDEEEEAKGMPCTQVNKVYGSSSNGTLCQYTIKVQCYCFYTIHHYNNTIQLGCRQGFVVYVINLTDGLLSQVPVPQSLEGYFKQCIRLSQLQLCSLYTIHS